MITLYVKDNVFSTIRKFNGVGAEVFPLKLKYEGRPTKRIRAGLFNIESD
jgi:hypothetical protein